MLDVKCKKKKIIVFLSILIGIVMLIGVVLFIYVGDYYHTTNEAEAFASTDTVVVEEKSFGYFVDGPATENAIVFYPGGKVEVSAYLPLLKEIANNGMDCFLVEMPFNLAVFDINRADEVIENYDYENWYIGGHSLGGAMASVYVSEHSNKIKGLALLGAYSTVDLSSIDIKVITIFGSNDQVLNKEKYEQCRGNLPKDFIEKVIDKGNHAWFGYYGEQNGDGKAEITHEEQWKETAASIINCFISSSNGRTFGNIK